MKNTKFLIILLSEMKLKVHTYTMVNHRTLSVQVPTYIDWYVVCGMVTAHTVFLYLYTRPAYIFIDFLQ